MAGQKKQKTVNVTMKYPVLDLELNDSEEMHKVRLNVSKCNQSLNTLVNPAEYDEKTRKNLEEMEKNLLNAINACRLYCDVKNPTSRPGRKRLKAVEDTMEILKAQYRRLGTIRTLIENPDKRYKEYPTQSRTIFGLMENVENKWMELQQAKAQDLSNLTFHDFVGAISAWNDDALEMRNGKLRTATNFLDKASQSGRATRDNRKMLEHLIKISVEQVLKSRKLRGLQDSEEYRKKLERRHRIYWSLELKGETTRPISMHKFRLYINEVSMGLSMVNNILRSRERQAPEKVAIAEAVSEMLDDTIRVNNLKQQKKTQMRNLRKFIDEGKKQGMDVRFSNKTLEELASGHLFAIKDTVYSLLQGIYSCAVNYQKDQKLDISTFTKDKNLMNRLFVYAMQNESATTDAEKRKIQEEYLRYCDTYAFQKAGKLELLENARKHNITDLIGGVSVPRAYVMQKYADVKAWEGREQQVAQGVVKLEKLCRLMYQQRVIMSQVASQGLSDEQSKKLLECGMKIQNMIDDPADWAQMALVTSQMSDTRFAKGFRELATLKERHAVDYKALSEQIVASARKAEAKAEEEQNSKEADATIAEPEKPQDQITEEKQASLQGAKRNIADLFLMKRPASRCILNNGIDNANSIMQLYRTLHELEEDGTKVESLILEDNLCTLYMDQNKNLVLTIGNTTLNTCQSPYAIARFLEADMCANMELYGKDKVTECIREDLAHTIDGESDSRSLTTDMLHDLLKSTANVEKESLVGYPTTDVARQVLQSLTQKMTAEEVLQNLEDRKNQKKEELKGELRKNGRKVHDIPDNLNDMEVLESIEKMREQEGQQSKVSFAADYHKPQDPAKAGLGWTKEENDIKEFLAELISPKDSWESEITHRTGPADRLRDAIYKHADTIAGIFQHPELLQQMMDRMGLDKLGLANLNILDILQQQLGNNIDNHNENEKLGMNKQIHSLLLRATGLNLDLNEFPEIYKALTTCEQQTIGTVIKGLVGGEDDVAKAADALAGIITDNELGEISQYIQKQIDSIEKKKDSISKELDDTVKEIRKPFASQIKNGRRRTSQEKKQLRDAEVKISELTQQHEQRIKECQQRIQQWKEQQLKVNTGRQVNGVFGLSAFYKKGISDLRSQIKLNDTLEAVDQFIGDQIDEGFAQIQQNINTQVDKSMVNGNPGSSGKIGDTDIFEEIGDVEVSDMVKKSMSGESGQGLFLKNVLKGYFVQADQQTKRNMIAGAIRGLQPSQLNDSVQDQKERERLKEVQMGSLMSGLFRGAGPLMQKFLQGVPTKGLPLSMQMAMDATKSHLNPISKVAVAAQMNSLVEKSEGYIDRIQVEGSLGSASIGEAFLCRIYGPTIAKEGREVVIKLVKPDVRQRMKKEEKFFLDCAEKTDAGMLKTIRGQLKVYNDELDLRKEAQNIEYGKIYNMPHSVKSEELAEHVLPSANAIMLKKANGDTVGNYFQKTRDRLEELKKQVEENPNQEFVNAALQELTATFYSLKSKHAYLVELGTKWISEGLFDSGFYQADLHKDNIMVDDNGVTIIDYGNATKLTEQQRKAIMHMVCAATCGYVDDFVDNYKLVMSEESKKIYPDIEQEFKTRLNNLFMKKGDPGSKILVALTEAQKLGLDLPNSIYNFSLGQVRLNNTIDDSIALLNEVAVKMREVSQYFTSANTKGDILDEYRKLYDARSSRNAVDDYKYSIQKKLGIKAEEGKTEISDEAKQNRVELLNKLLDSNDAEVQKAFLELPDTSKKLGQALEQIAKLGKDNPDFRFTLDDLKADSPHYKLVDTFSKNLVFALTTEKNQEADKKNADEQLNQERFNNFNDIIGNVIWDRLKDAAKIMGASGAKYAMRALKAKSDFDEQQNMINIDQIHSLYTINDKLLAMNQKLSAKNLSAEEIAVANREIAEDLKQIVDLNMPKHVKEFILQQLEQADKENGLSKAMQVGRGYLTRFFGTPKGSQLIYQDDYNRYMKLQADLDTAIKSLGRTSTQVEAQGSGKDAELNANAGQMLQVDASKSKKITDDFIKRLNEIRTSANEVDASSPDQTVYDQYSENKLLNDDSAYEYYQYYDDIIMDKDHAKLRESVYEDMNSNDINVLRKLKEQESTKKQLGGYLERRIRNINKINKIAEKAGDAHPLGQPKLENGELILKGVKQPECQNTGYGCWSVALSSLLRYRGVDLDQRTIRSYRPDSQAFEKNTIKEANADLPNNISNYTDLIQKVLPYTMVNELQCNEILTEKEAAKMIRECVELALYTHNSPLAFQTKGHYRTIFGLQGDTLLMYNPLKRAEEHMSLRDFVKMCGHTEMTDGGMETRYLFKAQWLQDMKLDKHGEPELGEALQEDGASYLGGELTNNNSSYVVSRYFKGFGSGKIGNTKFISYLPSNLKAKGKVLEGYYMDNLKAIADAAEKANVSPNVLDKLKKYPISWFGLDYLMKKWSRELTELYRTEGISDNDKQHIREALEEVKYSAILKEKIKIRKEINKNLRDMGDLSSADPKKRIAGTEAIEYNPDKPEKLAIMENVLKKALYLNSIEKMAPEDVRWLDKLDKEPTFELDQSEKLKKMIETLNTKSLVVQNMIQQVDPVAGKAVFTSKEIPYVRLMHEIEAGRCPDMEKLEQIVTKADHYMEAHQKPVAEQKVVKVAEQQVKQKAVNKAEMASVKEEKKVIQQNETGKTEEKKKKSTVMGAH